MVTENHYRWDFIGLSTDSKPTPATSEKVVDGSTFYCADNSKLYVYCEDAWYEKEAQGGYELPTASADTLGGVKVGDNLSINSETGVLSATDTTYSAFTGTDGETAGSTGLVPAPATTDAGKFLKADGTWDTAGGASINVVQTTGKSATDVMSQDATTGLIYYRTATGNYDNTKIRIGGYTGNVGNSMTIVGTTASLNAGNFFGATGVGNSIVLKGDGSSAFGYQANVSSATSGAVLGAVAIGAYSRATTKGEVNIGSSSTQYGYNSSNYRLLSGLYDGQDLHDAATVAQGNTLATTAPTTATVGVLGQLYTDTTTLHTYQCTAIDDTDPASILYTWTQRW